MSKDDLTVAALIDLLGGNQAVSEFCGVGVTAVINWRTWNRIPPRLHFRFDRWCREENIKVPKNFWDRMEDPVTT